jgi:hypothetical protein
MKKIFDSDVVRKIEKLEWKQIRSMIELFDDPSNLEARTKHDERKAQIQALRSTLSTQRQDSGEA